MNSLELLIMAFIGSLSATHPPIVEETIDKAWLCSGASIPELSFSVERQFTYETNNIQVNGGLYYIAINNTLDKATPTKYLPLQLEQFSKTTGLGFRPLGESGTNNFKVQLSTNEIDVTLTTPEEDILQCTLSYLDETRYANTMKGQVSKYLSDKNKRNKTTISFNDLAIVGEKHITRYEKLFYVYVNLTDTKNEKTTTWTKLFIIKRFKDGSHKVISGL